jgi:hypothetical protein
MPLKAQEASTMSSSRTNFQPEQIGLEAPRGSEALRAQDHWRVNLHEPWEVGFWAREFRCSAEELRHAVQCVGARAGDVRAYLDESRLQLRT